MAWDPSVLRKYSTTSHFRLLNQVRSELKSSPLSRNQDGELSLGMGRRGPSYRVPVEVRQANPTPRATRTVAPQTSLPFADTDGLSGDSTSFRERLRAIDMR
ncbi:MAG: hypothetical protein VKM17_03900 [Cyanobacteriota bacterium]|nr:hypothetical protein [Cyanobacteriota bacterium]